MKVLPFEILSAKISLFKWDWRSLATKQVSYDLKSIHCTCIYRVSLSFSKQIKSDFQTTIMHIFQFLTNPKFKSRLTTWFSLKSDFPTTHPPRHPQPDGKVSKKQGNTIFQKQKLLVYNRRLYNMFWNKRRPNNHLLRVKKS